MAPFAIYPFPAEDCAALICDYMIFETILDPGKLAEMLEGSGLRAEVVLPAANGDMALDGDVIQISGAGIGMTVHTQALNLLLYELLRPDVWAAGIHEALLQANPPSEPVLSFRDELRTWTGRRPRPGHPDDVTIRLPSQSFAISTRSQGLLRGSVPATVHRTNDPRAYRTPGRRLRRRSDRRIARRLRDRLKTEATTIGATRRGRDLVVCPRLGSSQGDAL
jgi:hypothetical protein